MCCQVLRKTKESKKGMDPSILGTSVVNCMVGQ